MNDQRHVADCPHLELAVGWALHALEPAEESLVAAHMPDCPTCTDIIAETERAGATLGLSVPEAIPSAELEQRVLGVTQRGEAAPVVPLPLPMRPVRHTTMPSRPGIGWLAAAAAVVLIAGVVVLGVRVVQLGDERNQAARQVTEMSEAIRAAADPAAVRVPLLATNDGGSVGMVLASRDGVAVVATRLPSNRTADQIYVLWGLGNGVPTALAAFDVASDAPRLHDVSSARGTGEFTGYAVSLEPGRRAPATPTDVVASGQVTS